MDFNRQYKTGRRRIQTMLDTALHSGIALTRRRLFGKITSLRYLLLLIPLGIVGCSMTTVKPPSEKQTAEIGGHKFEYVLAGAGQPVIVFVSGYGADIDVS
jgi:hypothetical protein